MTWLVVWLALHPVAASCPAGHDLRTGVRRSGAYKCWPAPVAPRDWSVARQGQVTDWDGTWQRPERSVQPDGAIAGRVYCFGGATPRQDGQRVWCEL